VFFFGFDISERGKRYGQVSRRSRGGNWRADEQYTSGHGVNRHSAQENFWKPTVRLLSGCWYLWNGAGGARQGELAKHD
jgi:hypothetical protein